MTPRTRTFSLAAAAIVALAAVGASGYWLGTRQGSGPTSAGEREILYWYDPMVPDQHFDKPGKSPFMDMELVPRHAGEGDASTAVRIDPGVVQNLGVRYAVVERGDVGQKLSVSGTLTYNGRAVAAVQAKQEGFVERSRDRAIGDVVRAGDPIVDLRVPAWTAALAEYLSLRKGADTALVESARARLGMLGVPGEAVNEAERSGSAPATFIVRAPISGALVALDARQGMSIAAGAPIASISGLSPVWLIVAVPQGSLGDIANGASATAMFPAFPGERFSGKIEAILPSANLANRTVEVRIALPNPDGRLRPGMTGAVDITSDEARQALLVPSGAVIRTGQRTVVIAARPDGGFEPRDVSLGGAVGERQEIIAGLTEGERVVASGQFLIDSEANLSGVLERLRGGSGTAASDAYESTGKITAVDANGVTIAHAPVAALNWPEMTMAFGWGGQPRDFKVGDEVAFSFRKGGAGYVLMAIRKAGASL